jgi:hypothetical protein
VTDRANVQTAPYPQELAELVAQLTYRPGYHVSMRDLDRGQDSEGLTLVVRLHVPDSYHPERNISVDHYFPVPPAAYDVRSWQRWLFDRLGDVDTHERAEHFAVAGKKPYAPSHGPGNDPYMVREVGTDTDQRTSFRGELNP